MRAERKATSRRKWSEDLAHVIASPMGVEVRMCACRFSKEVSRGEHGLAINGWLLLVVHVYKI